MKKKGIIIFLVILVIIVAGVIVFNTTKNKEEEKTGETVQYKTYSLKYKDVDITPGKQFAEGDISEECEYSEIDSCAFDGKDKVYTYSQVEINVAEINGVDSVYSVYFLEPEMKTPEGVGLSDSKDDMLKAYGNNYEQSSENTYTYSDGVTNITFLVENDVITSIEYTLLVTNN